MPLLTSDEAMPLFNGGYSGRPQRWPITRHKQQKRMAVGTCPLSFSFCPDDKIPRKIEIVQQGDERFILKVFADGREEREPIVKLPRKKRYPPRPYWHWDLSKIRKKDF